MFRFEDLEIWKQAIVLCKEIFEVADNFPQKVHFSLGSQLRAAVLSVSNNIAEGSGSNSTQEFKSFLNYAIRSVYEVVSMLVVSRDTGYLSQDNFKKYYDDLEILVRKIRSFRNKI